MTEPTDPKEEFSPAPTAEASRLDQDSPSQAMRSRISFTDRSAAKWATGIAVMALIGLAISLVEGKGTDLTHIALALAIIAFTLQIGFFAMQLWVASEQDHRSGDLFRQTRTVLTQIETSTEDTVKVIQDQFRFVLEHALGERRPTVPSLLAPERTGISQTLMERSASNALSVDSMDLDASAEPAASVAENSPEDIKTSLAEIENKVDALIHGTQTSAEQQDILRRWDAISRKQVEQASRPGASISRELRSWPNEALGKQAFSIRQKLSPEARACLDSIARRRLELIDNGDPRPLKAVRVEAPFEPFYELEKAGLIRLTTARDKAGNQHRNATMKSLGRTVAALSTAVGMVPAWYASMTKDIDS
jgi:hypothetical protein